MITKKNQICFLKIHKSYKLTKNVKVQGSSFRKRKSSKTTLVLSIPNIYWKYTMKELYSKPDYSFLYLTLIPQNVSRCDVRCGLWPFKKLWLDLGIKQNSFITYSSFMDFPIVQRGSLSAPLRQTLCFLCVCLE